MMNAVRRKIVTVLAVLCSLCAFWHASAAANQDRTPIYHLRIEGVINPIKVRYIENAFHQAVEDHARLIVISINTPGGLVESMDQIVSTMVNSPVPVVSFVEPRTAMATSAGTFIVLAGDVAAMVPGTTIGSAHPVGGQGEKIEGPMEEKVMNVLVSKARSLAERRHRNVEFAEQSVRSSQNLTAQAAKDSKVIELLASDVPDLLRQLDGYCIEHHGAGQGGGRRHGARLGISGDDLDDRRDTLFTAGAPILEIPMSRAEKFLDALANPSVAYILMTLGVMGLIYEFGAPGIGLGAVVGSICLILGLLSLSALPIHIGGVLLILLGLVMLLAELKVQSMGILTLGGIAALILGAFVLIDSGKYYGAVQEIKFGVVLPLIITIALTMIFALRLTIRALRSPQRMGEESMAGMMGHAKSDLASGMTGMVFVDGALWDAQREGTGDSASRPIRSGEEIEVIRLDGGKLIVRLRKRSMEEDS